MAASISQDSPPERPARVLWSREAASSIGEGDCGSASYWRRVASGSFRPAVNLTGRAGWVAHGDFGCPITVHDRQGNDSYPVSLMTQYLDYPREELDVLPTGSGRLAARLGLAGLGLILRAAQADRTVQWNSWMFSTNPVPAGLQDSSEAITRALALEFPDHAVVLRNVDPLGAPGLSDRLAAQGHRLLTARLVHHYDARNRPLRQTSTLGRDQKELSKVDEYRWVGPWDIEISEAGRIANLYRQLYLEKHSRLNPQYDEPFVREAIRDHWLEFHGLRDRTGRLVGVFGFFSLDDRITTVPFIGYDTSLGADLGIYRRLFLRIHQEVDRRGQLLNYSSGAGEFKRRRGSIPSVEYNAVYDRHLPARRRMAFRVAALLLNRLARPWLESSGL